jgi:hypothetical protein
VNQKPELHLRHAVEAAYGSISRRFVERSVQQDSARKQAWLLRAQSFDPRNRKETRRG